VVSPATIGGKRMAHELLRPSVVGFLELIGPEASKARNLCIEEVVLPKGSPLQGGSWPSPTSARCPTRSSGGIRTGGR